MLDYSRIEQYRENNRIEAKKAAGGLPHSIWETYSAFANTLGGVILLGVEELPDHSLRPIHLPRAEQLVEEFWRAVNDPKKASVNILTDKSVVIHEQDGCRFISITVPRAQRYDKPVYVEGNPLTGTYRRNGEGDYRCKPEAVQAMLRDAAAKSQDMTVLETLPLPALDADSIRRYRLRMQTHRPGHVWETLEDADFLYRVGAAGRGEDGRLHPTAAGLLMLGHEEEIVRAFPSYFLDYQERMEDDDRWTDRLTSSSGGWSGNLLDFYFRVCSRLQQGIRVPSRADSGGRMDDTPVHTALREALANCLINADYHGVRGLVIVRRRDSVTLSNPGSFRIALEDAKSGGLSDPRNTALMRMFNLINVGTHTGSGIPGILSVWKRQGWAEPVLTEELSPERITLTLPMHGGESAVDHSGGPKAGIRPDGRIAAQHKACIIDYLTDHVTATSAELAELLGLKQPRVRELLAELQQADVVVAQGANRSRTYRLKA
ncbi:MAG: RNA-binding domain-containing protein [Aristaeellaceae bacterium]